MATLLNIVGIHDIICLSLLGFSQVEKYGALKFVAKASMDNPEIKNM